MQRLILLALLPLILSPAVARAQSPSQLLCGPAEREWAKVRNGGDLAAMDRVINRIGPHCSAVLGANARRAAVERDLERHVSVTRPTLVRASVSVADRTGAQAFAQGQAAYNAKDYALAMTWYQEAAAQGSAEAQNGIGWLYQNGWGVPEKDAQAMAWYLKAAAQGNAQAQTNIGFLYEHGWGVAPDYAQAMAWYRKAAAQGNAQAQSSIGALYQNGWGVTQDNAQARSWYEKAAAGGYPDAKAWLAQHPH
jgi:TPR repeat protein